MKKLCKMLGLNVLYILAYFAIFKSVVYLWYNVLANNPMIGEWIKGNQLGLVVANDVFAIPIFVVLVYLVKKQSIFKVTLAKPISLHNVALSVIIGLGMGIFVINTFALPFFKQMPIFNELLQYIYNSNLLVFAGFVIIGTFFKEMLFRGLVFNELSKAMPLFLAIIIQAVIYGALFFNFDPPLTIFGMLGNIVVVLIYIKTKSIWAPYIAQASNNICIYSILNFSGDFFEGYRIPGIILSIVIIGGALFLMYRRKQNTSFLEDGEAVAK